MPINPPAPSPTVPHQVKRKLVPLWPVVITAAFGAAAGLAYSGPETTAWWLAGIAVSWTLGRQR